MSVSVVEWTGRERTLLPMKALPSRYESLCDCMSAAKIVLSGRLLSNAKRICRQQSYEPHSLCAVLDAITHGESLQMRTRSRKVSKDGANGMLEFVGYQ